MPKSELFPRIPNEVDAGGGSGQLTKMLVLFEMLYLKESPVEIIRAFR